MIMLLKKLVSLIIIIVPICLSAQVSSPSPYSGNVKINYVRTWDLKAPESNPANIPGRPLKDAVQRTQYLDGLGRPLQMVVKQGSLATGNNAVDLVSPVIYDQFGREIYTYLTFAANNTGGNSSINDGLFKLNPFQEQAAFSAVQYPGESYYYNQTNFEPSPLNRIEKKMAPGNNWVGGARGVRTEITYNDINEKIWCIGSAEGSLPYVAGNYVNGDLTRNATYDEHDNASFEYIDKAGRTVMKAIPVGSEWLLTYYVYDDLGNLRCVIPPKAVTAIWSNWVMTQAVMDELCYRYEYDAENRMIIKKVPGAGEERMVYDQWDRVVLVQDANLRLANKWVFTKYDGLNRPILTGLYVNGTYTTRESMQTYLTSQNLSRYENYSPSGGLPMYTLSQSFPVVTYADVLTVTWYDDYAWTAGVSPEFRTFESGYNALFFLSPSNTIYPYPQSLQPADQTRSLITGTLTKVLDGSRSLVTTHFYDDKGRVIQTKSENYTGGCDITTTQYSFSGQPLVGFVRHQKAGTNPQTHIVVTKMEYDDLGRVSKIRKTVNSVINGVILDKPEQVILSNEYDALGQLKKKSLGSPVIDSLRYDYNIQGWLLGINRNFIKDQGDNKFGFELGYDKPATIISGATYTSPQFNGNISGTTWKSAGDNEKRKYDYTYDNFSRLTNAAFTQYSGGGFNTNANIDFSVRNLSYDPNGNILSMDQKGWRLSGSTTIDSLLYTYYDNSNRLKSVLDRANDPQTQLGDFRSSSLYMTGLGGTKTIAAVDYTYDGNGNLKKDLNKDIGNSGTDGITYNHLNMPETITVRTTGGSVKGTVTYTYDASGNKLKKLVQETGKPDRTTLYIGGLQYENDTLQFIAHEEGWIRYAKRYFQNGDSSWQFLYDYFLKDQLGNVRMVLTEQKDTALYAATMEAAYRTKETRLFSNIPESSYPKNLVPGGYPADASTTNPNDSLARLNGSGKKVGPSLVLRVMSGDKIDLGVKSFYRPQGSAGPVNDPVSEILSSLADGIVGAVGEGKGTISQLNNVSTSPLVGVLNDFRQNNNPNTGSKPKAYLNWILLDEQFKYTGASSGALPVNNPDVIEVLSPSTVTVNRNGFLYIYVSNETQNWDVFFNDLSVQHYSGPIVEETHYYPFGLVMAGISSKVYGKLENKKQRFQGQEFNDALNVNYYEFRYRNHDPQIGKFIQIDPLSDKYPYNSTYAFSENKVTGHIELEGLETIAISLLGNNTTIVRSPVIENIIKPGVEVGGKIGKTTTETGNKLPKIEDHHIIPKYFKDDPVIESARDGGFKFEGTENKMPIEKFSRATGEGRHGNHPNYNTEVARRLVDFRRRFPNATSEQSAEFLRLTVKEFKDMINASPNTKINDLFKSALPPQGVDGIIIGIPKPESKGAKPKEDEKKPCGCACIPGCS